MIITLKLHRLQQKISRVSLVTIQTLTLLISLKEACFETPSLSYSSVSAMLSVYIYNTRIAGTPARGSDMSESNNHSFGSDTI